MDNQERFNCHYTTQDCRMKKRKAAPGSLVTRHQEHSGTTDRIWAHGATACCVISSAQVEDDGGCLEASGKTPGLKSADDWHVLCPQLWMSGPAAFLIFTLRSVRCIPTAAGPRDDVDITAAEIKAGTECVSPSGNTASHSMLLQRCCDIWNCSPRFFTADQVGIALQSLLILQLCLLDISFKSSACFFWHWIEQSTLHSSRLSGRGAILLSL